MKYKIYKLSFSTAVHFGSGRLGSTDDIFLADRLFSAMCIEAVRTYGPEGAKRLADMARQGRLALSDGFPYMGKTLYIPKPIIHIETGDAGNSAVKKAFKKLRFIPQGKLQDYLRGELDAPAEAEVLSKLGKKTEKISAAVSGRDDTLPYRIGTYEFSENCGLYFILGYDSDEVYELADGLIYSLGYEGIGGKVSSGLGKFTFADEDIPDDLAKALGGGHKRYMALSVCMARDSEMERAVCGACYSLVKRSGFISSTDYANRQVKKRTVYFFSSGSCFDCTFEGDVFDLGGKGSHPVYRYAKPMLMGVM